MGELVLGAVAGGGSFRKVSQENISEKVMSEQRRGSNPSCYLGQSAPGQGNSARRSAGGNVRGLCEEQQWPSGWTRTRWGRGGEEW